ncbi:hypothetical protein [Pseudoxanthomonas sp. z9]|uniref:hypothetical protein n=1 Tax=Pseudoxanthomonas sp. z9 TaxID=2584942 RepID=UPI0011412473|nr:hypothetical protein [Pseudoxanthomonas sp. z9]
MKTASVIRDVVLELPALAASSSGAEPTLEEMYFPESHMEALDPDVALVIGNRGMGKTFWSLALANDDTRAAISARYSVGKAWGLSDVIVKFGFSDAEGSKGTISRAHLEKIAKRVPTDIIWRAVLVKDLAEIGKIKVPQEFSKLVEWLRSNPDNQVSVFRSADLELSKNGKRILFIFDQLDQLATEWTRIQELTQGLLKTALAMRSYKSIRLKIFMRPDQAENRGLFRFPDASKISGSAKRLAWKVSDLYGLFFFEVFRRQEGKAALSRYCKRVGVNPVDVHSRLGIPTGLVSNPNSQGKLFDLIAGAMMGGGAKRGRPYTWIPTHLSDAKGEISPRTFLKVMRTAASENDLDNPRTAMNHLGIIQGVREASGDRLRELEEDYPWISTALKPLRGLLVPCEPAEVYGKWKHDDTVDVIKSRYSGASAPIELVVTEGLHKHEVYSMLAILLSEVGVLEQRTNGKFNIPDIFRVNAGILRKGGVAPQQRNKFQ